MPYTDIDAYMNARNIAVNANNALWFYNQPNAAPPLTADERALDTNMAAHRQKIVDNFTKYDLEFPPEEPFYKVKGLIEKTKLFQAFRTMPKGAQLHMHTSACASAEWILDTLKNNRFTNLPHAYIYIASKFGKNQYIDRQMAFFATPPQGFEDAATLLKDDAFYNDMLDRLTFRSERIESIPYIWDEFNRIFALTDELLKNETFYTMYYTKAFNLLIEDNINYLEMRTGFASFRPGGVSDEIQPNNGNPNAQLIQTEYATMQSILRNDFKFLDTLKSIVAGINDGEVLDFSTRFTLKVILCGNRATNRMEDARLKLSRAYTLRESGGYSNFIVGFDLVGEEDRGTQTADFVKTIIDMGMQNSMDFYFHDGESNWAFNDNIIDAYLIGNRRIGHGFNIIKYPDIAQRFIHDQNANNAKRALEICPISNQMLRYTPDLRNHPAFSLLKSGMQCVICNDDPQLFMNTGLSYDFWMVYVAFNLNLSQLKRLILNSYYYSALNDGDKRTIIQDFLIKWDQFVIQANVLLG